MNYRATLSRTKRMPENWRFFIHYCQHSTRACIGGRRTEDPTFIRSRSPLRLRRSAGLRVALTTNRLLDPDPRVGFIQCRPSGPNRMRPGRRGGMHSLLDDFRRTHHFPNPNTRFGVCGHQIPAVCRELKKEDVYLFGNTFEGSKGGRWSVVIFLPSDRSYRVIRAFSGSSVVATATISCSGCPATAVPRLWLGSRS